MYILIENWDSLDPNIRSHIKCDMVIPFDMSNIDNIDHNISHTYIYIDDINSQYRINPELLLIVKNNLEKRGKKFNIHAYFKNKEFVDVPRLQYHQSLDSLFKKAFDTT